MNTENQFRFVQASSEIELNMTHCTWFEDFTIFVFLLFPSMLLLKSCPLLTKAARFVLLLKAVCVKFWPSQLFHLLELRISVERVILLTCVLKILKDCRNLDTVILMQDMYVCVCVHALFL